ncbi:MAG: hypothetical protein J0I08_20740 [Rhizobiales bacterium]|nr:hypothetical protein [Hyphomicrobiales bacterium]
MPDDENFTCMHDVLDALEAVIASSDPKKREALAAAIDGYAESFPEDFHWSISAQSPSLLNHLVMVIDWSCRPEAETKPRPAIRLVDRKPMGNA